jgi:hypothetical protein
MPAATASLFFLEDLEDVSRTGQLAESDLRSLRTVADRIKTFVTGRNKDLGRAGAVYPFVPMALERKALWKVIVSRPAPPLCSPRMDGTGEN